MSKTFNSIDFQPGIITFRNVIYISLFSYIGYISLYALVDVKLFLPAILTIGIYLLLHTLFFLLVRNKRYNLSKLLFLFLSDVVLILLCYFILGAKSNVHYYFLVFSLLSLPLNGTNSVWFSVFYFCLNLLFFAGLEFNFVDIQPMIQFPHELVQLFHLKCILVSFAITFYLLWLYFRISEEKTAHLIQSHAELNEINCQLEETQQKVEAQQSNLQDLNFQLQANLEYTTLQNKELEIANKTKDKFFSIIAHDLKNPLSSLIGLAKLLNNRVDSYSADKIKLFTTGISDSANNLNTLVLNLLSWARSQTGSITPNKSDFKLRELILANHTLFKQMLEEKEIDLKIACEPDLSVYADKDMIDTVLRNLLSNAIKFSLKGTVIKVSAAEDELCTKMHVSDSGVGIHSEKLDTIFNIGEVESTPGTNREKGSGLGLIICQEFLKLNDCSLSVTSELGKGSVFTISFPSY